MPIRFQILSGCMHWKETIRIPNLKAFEYFKLSKPIINESIKKSNETFFFNSINIMSIRNCHFFELDMYKATHKPVEK